MRVAALLFALFVGLAPAPAGATVAVHPGDVWVAAGDSITAQNWANADPGMGELYERVLASFPPVVTPPMPGRPAAPSTLVVTGTRGRVVQAGSASSVTLINSGFNGSTAADLAAFVTSRITTYSPTFVTLLIGANDALQATDPAAFRGSYDSILSQLKAYSASLRVVCVGIWLWGEHWGAGPVWANGAADTAVDNLNAQVSASCAAQGYEYADSRPTALTWEAANNTPSPGAAAGLLTANDGLAVHPTPTGRVQLGNAVLPHLTFP